MATVSQQDLIELEKKLLDRQEAIEEKREQLEKEKEEVASERKKYIKKLEQVSHLTTDEAKDQLLAETEKDAAAMMARILREKEEEAKDDLCCKDGTTNALSRSIDSLTF